MFVTPFKLFLTATGAVCAAFLLPSGVNASEHFLLPQKAVSAWTCSVLAAASADTLEDGETTRLFSLGIKYGKEALEAERRGEFKELSPEVLVNHFPEQWKFTAVNPASDDFKLGAVYAEVLDSTVDDLVQGWTPFDGFTFSGVDRASQRAKEQYTKRGCASLR